MSPLDLGPFGLAMLSLVLATGTMELPVRASTPRARLQILPCEQPSRSISVVMIALGMTSPEYLDEVEVSIKSVFLSAPALPFTVHVIVDPEAATAWRLRLNATELMRCAHEHCEQRAAESWRGPAAARIRFHVLGSGTSQFACQSSACWKTELNAWRVPAARLAP